MLETLTDALLPIAFSTMVAVVGAIMLVWLANKSGVGDIAKVVDRETDRLVAAQAERIKLLEKKVAELERSLSAAKIREDMLLARIDALEKLVADEQIEKLGK